MTTRKVMLHFCLFDRTCRSVGHYAVYLRIGPRWWRWNINRRMKFIDDRIEWRRGIDIERPRRLRR